AGSLTAPIDKGETLKTKEEELKHDRASVSLRVRKNPVSPQRGVSQVITRIPLETSPWKQEGGSRGSQRLPFKGKDGPGNIVERLIEGTPVADHAKHTMEQPSHVSVLDAFYTEESPSPVRKRLNTLYGAYDEYIHFEEAQANNTNVNHHSEFNIMKLENIKSLVHQIELLNTNTDDDATIVNDTISFSSDGETGDHRYGFLFNSVLK
nr:protein longifolia 2-like [Tanacetum cinerariifolium]